MFQLKNKQAHIRFKFHSFPKLQADSVSGKLPKDEGWLWTIYEAIHQQGKHPPKYLVSLMQTRLATVFHPSLLIKRYQVMYRGYICTSVEWRDQWSVFNLFDRSLMPLIKLAAPVKNNLVQGWRPVGFSGLRPRMCQLESMWANMILVRNGETEKKRKLVQKQN